MSNELTFYDRQQLQHWLRLKISLRHIARTMRKDVSVLSREISRNSSGRDKYRADTAQRLCDKRKHIQHKGKLDKYPELKKYVEEKLVLDWSPEQIAGRLKKHPSPELKGLDISHESIYYWIYEKSEKYKQLYKHLRTHREKRYNYGKRKSKKITIPSRISIHDRPDIVDKKDRFGDWETDSMIFSNQKDIMSVQYERKSMSVRMCKLDNKTADETYRALIQTIDSLPQYMFKTMTFDNGTEGVRHTDIKKEYNIGTYFCDPYCSWQKGGVENMNKLIRQYLPRSIKLKNLSYDDIYNMQEKLNNRPRKGLNYSTPNEVINKSVALKP